MLRSILDKAERDVERKVACVLLGSSNTFGTSSSR